VRVRVSTPTQAVGKSCPNPYLFDRSQVFRAIGVECSIQLSFILETVHISSFIPHNGYFLRFPVIKLTIASGNPHKVAEIGSMLGPLPLEVVLQPPELDVEETGQTYYENAFLKATAASQLTGTWALADDSGLEVDALDNAPGLFTARFADSDQEKISKLIQLMTGHPYRSARFISAMVLCSPDGTSVESSEGICWGELLHTPAYPDGGLESMFWIRETRCSYGEMTQDQLKRLGSRGKAARAMAPRLRRELGL